LFFDTFYFSIKGFLMIQTEDHKTVSKPTLFKTIQAKMHTNIQENKQYAIRTLEEGLARSCADDIAEVLVNLDDNTCDYVELIPILEKIASARSFYYFDDNGAGGFPRPDFNRETSFRGLALRAIENIKENARIESNSEIAAVLKGNDTHLIKTTLEHLEAEGLCDDKSLIPILEKIAQKDVYKKYSYYGGLQNDCELGMLARDVIQLIVRNSERAKSVYCSVCQPLGYDLVVNTGREEYFPSAFNRLVCMDGDFRSEFRRCPGCAIYFHWIDMSSWTGSGNNDEERLVRISIKGSELLDKLFSDDPKAPSDDIEVREYFDTLPTDLLVSALKKRVYKFSHLVTPFVPELLRLLAQNEQDFSVWELLGGYISNNPEHAEKVLKANFRLTGIFQRCLKLVEEKNKPGNI
jgi:hypothetical protein